VKWEKWEKICKPKSEGGWGLKDLNLFAQALAARLIWHFISVIGLWHIVFIRKYIYPSFNDGLDWKPCAGRNWHLSFLASSHHPFLLLDLVLLGKLGIENLSQFWVTSGLVWMLISRWQKV
jgi:hypothetical protein